MARSFDKKYLRVMIGRLLLGSIVNDRLNPTSHRQLELNGFVAVIQMGLPTDFASWNKTGGTQKHTTDPCIVRIDCIVLKVTSRYQDARTPPCLCVCCIFLPGSSPCLHSTTLPQLPVHNQHPSSDVDIRFLLHWLVLVSIFVVSGGFYAPFDRIFLFCVGIHQLLFATFLNDHRGLLWYAPYFSLSSARSVARS